MNYSKVRMNMGQQSTLVHKTRSANHSIDIRAFQTESIDITAITDQLELFLQAEISVVNRVQKTRLKKHSVKARNDLS